MNKPSLTPLNKIDYAEMEQRVVSEIGRHDYTFHALVAIETYLEEKGVEVVMLYNAIYNPKTGGLQKGTRLFTINNVPTKFYHEVVVPGLREVCARWKVCIIPDVYEKIEDNRRCLSGVFAIQFERVDFDILRNLYDKGIDKHAVYLSQTTNLAMKYAVKQLNVKLAP